MNIYGTSTSTFPSDAYGVDTDIPDTPYEIIDGCFNKTCREAVSLGFREWYKEWLRETASEYFDTSDWNEDWWKAWKDYVEDIV